MNSLRNLCLAVKRGRSFHSIQTRENNASPSAREKRLRVVGLTRSAERRSGGIACNFDRLRRQKTVKQRVRNLSGTGLILAQFGASATSHSYNSCNSIRLAPAMVKALQTPLRRACGRHLGRPLSKRKKTAVGLREQPSETVNRRLLRRVPPIEVQPRNWILHLFAGMEK